MIRYLDIQRLAVIDALQVELEPGLNVVTGETGAGKSVLVGAIGLLLGGRASPELVRTGADEARVQAVFEDGEGGEHVVRREVATQGRSRAFIDDVLATTAALRTLAGALVDLHGQHEHQALLDPTTHLALLDAYADTTEARQEVADTFTGWRDAQAALARARADETDWTERTDRSRSELQEIERVAPRADEDRELDAELQILRNAATLHRSCSDAYLELYEGDDAVLGRLRAMWRTLDELAELDPRFLPYTQARAGIDSQLEDLAFFLRSYAGAIDVSPERLQQAEDRLALLERLKRRCGAPLSDIITSQTRLRAELDRHGDAAARINQLERELEATRHLYLTRAGELSRARHTAATDLARSLDGVLAQLAMPRARCDFRLRSWGEDEARWTEDGIDDGELYLSPNPGEEPRRLARIASGGELSRVALALRTLTSADAPGKTLIFDEVDAGIGGHVADVVGGCSGVWRTAIRSSASRTSRRSPPTDSIISGSARPCARAARRRGSRFWGWRLGRRSWRG